MLYFRNGSSNSNEDNSESNSPPIGGYLYSVHVNPLILPVVSDWRTYLVNLTECLVSKAFLLRDKYNSSQYLIPEYNFLTNSIKSASPETLMFLLYAYEITKNRNYLACAKKVGFELINQNMTTNPAYFFWLYNLTKVEIFYIYGVKIADITIKEIENISIPHKEEKIYYIPWGIMNARLGPLLESYQITGNKTYLNQALRLMLGLFKYLKNNNTGLLYNSYRFSSGKLKYNEPYTRVYVPGLVITALIYLYIHTGNVKVYQILREYVHSVLTYFWVEHKAGMYIQKGNELYEESHYIQHWAYRVYVSSGKPAWPTIETNFFKLDYALFLYYMFIERNEEILQRILLDLNTSIKYDAVNSIFRHSLLDLTGLFHGQLGSIIYLITALKKFDFADYTEWIERHFLSVFTAFMKEFGIVYSIRLTNYSPGYYNPYLALTSTAYIYSMLKYVEIIIEGEHYASRSRFISNNTIKENLPFPFLYNPNVEIPSSVQLVT